MADDVLDDYREALQSVQQWAAAYPISVFPEPDLAGVKRVLEAAGMLNQMDRMHASWARHIVEGIGKIAGTALSKDHPHAQ